MNNNHQPQKTPNNGGYHAFIMLYLTINGFATGNTIRNAMHMIENGYERDKMITMLLWVLLIVYSAQRVYEVNRDRKKINNNKTR